MLTPSPAIEWIMHALTGMKWPQANEDELRNAADLYDSVGNDYKQLDDQLVQLLQSIRQNFEGDAATAFLNLGQVIAGGKDSFLDAAAEQSQQMAKTARDTATQAEYTKWMMLAQLIELLAEFMYAMAFSWVPGFGEALLEGLSWRTLFTRVFLKMLIKELLKRIAQHVALGVGMGIAMDRIIQMVQIGQGNRDKFDNKLLLDAIKFGAIQGLVTGPLSLLAPGIGKWLGNKLGKGLSKLLTTELKTLFKTLEKVGGKGGANDLAKNVAKLLSNHDLSLTKGFTKLGGKEGAKATTENFIKNMGKEFAKSPINGFTKEESRQIGKTWAKTVTEHWSGPTKGAAEALSKELTRELGSTLDKNALKVLAHDMPQTLMHMGFQGNKRFRLGMVGSGLLVESIGQNLGEGFYNLIYQDGFSTSWDTFVAGMLTGGLSHGGHVYLVHPVVHAMSHHFDTSGLGGGFDKGLDKNFDLDLPTGLDKNVAGDLDEHLDHLDVEDDPDYFNMSDSDTDSLYSDTSTVHTSHDQVTPVKPVATTSSDSTVPTVNHTNDVQHTNTSDSSNSQNHSENPVAPVAPVPQGAPNTSVPPANTAPTTSPNLSSTHASSPNTPHAASSPRRPNQSPFCRTMARAAATTSS